MTTLYEQTQKFSKCGKMSVLQGGSDNRFLILSTPDGNGNLRCSSWENSIEDCMKSIGCFMGFTKDELNLKYSFVKTIDFVSLGDGYEDEEKVRILPNAKEECKKYNFSWDSLKEQMVKDGFGFIHNKVGLDYSVSNKDKSFIEVFPRTVLEPFFEENVKKETVKIGEAVYDKKEFEEAIKDLKKLN